MFTDKNFIAGSMRANRPEYPDFLLSQAKNIFRDRPQVYDLTRTKLSVKYGSIFQKAQDRGVSTEPNQFHCHIKTPVVIFNKMFIYIKGLMDFLSRLKTSNPDI